MPQRASILPELLRRSAWSRATWSRAAWAVAAAVYVAVVALFAAKYLGRVGSGAALAAGYAVAAAGAVWGAARFSDVWSRPAVAAVVLAVALVAAVALARVAPETLRVDRHLMIETVVENVRDGVYPYTPRYPNAPGPSPVYFVLTVPFYLAGDVGWVSVVALAGFAVLAHAHLGARRALVAVVLVAASLPFWYEVVARSTLLANGVLAAGLVWPMARAEGGRTARAVAGWGALAGLLLSTRSVMALVVGGVALYAYARPGRPLRPGGLVGFGAVAAAVFALTVLPVWAWDPAAFAETNPFLTQAKLSNPAYTALGIAAAALAGLVARTPSGLGLGLGLALGLVVGAPIAAGLAAAGWDATVTQSGADIAYFTMAMPLLALALAAGPARHTEALP